MWHMYWWCSSVYLIIYQSWSQISSHDTTPSGWAVPQCGWFLGLCLKQGMFVCNLSVSFVKNHTCINLSIKNRCFFCIYRVSLLLYWSSFIMSKLASYIAIKHAVVLFHSKNKGLVEHLKELLFEKLRVYFILESLVSFSSLSFICLFTFEHLSHTIICWDAIMDLQAFDFYILIA